MTLKMSKTLRFWVESEYADRCDESSKIEKLQFLSEILREFEACGDAMRYLSRSGEIMWKPTPRMLQRLADAEREARAEMEDWP
jgi:hypothetical protein